MSAGVTTLPAVAFSYCPSPRRISQHSSPTHPPGLLLRTRSLPRVAACPERPFYERAMRAYGQVRKAGFAPPGNVRIHHAGFAATGLAGRLHHQEATLTWNTVAGAARYELSVWSDNEWIDSNHDIFTDPDRSSLTPEIGDGKATVSPLYLSRYQFRVRAVNNIGASGWSEIAIVE